MKCCVQHNMAENKELSVDDSLKAKSILPFDTFQSWLQCVCVVTFDLELGQAMEVRIYHYVAVFTFLPIMFSFYVCCCV